MGTRAPAVMPVVVAVLLGLAACTGPASPEAGSSRAPVSRAPEVAPPAPGADAPATTTDIAVPAAVATSAGRVATLPATRTARFALLGVTWDRGADDAQVTAEVRVRTRDGWTGWERLEVDTETDEGGRSGTEPWWVDSAAEVSARVTTARGPAPTGVRVVTVDPGEDDAPVTASPALYRTGTGTAAVTVADGRPTYTPRPAIITRSSWRAKASKGCDDPPTYPQYGTTTEGVLLHHTAGSNSYSRSQSASVVRGIQSFHMKGRGWCDIAYNFLVDRYGQVYMGRDGGADRQVRGSHAGNSTVNEQTMGVALMGNLDRAKPTSAMKSATVKLVGWRVGTTFLPARGTYRIAGKTLQRIAGHRNVVGTACPGRYGYAWLKADGGLRDRVAAYTSGYTSAIKTAAAALPSSIKGVVEIGESAGTTSRRMVWSKLDFYWLDGVGAFPVAGSVRTAYGRAGGSAGALGFPTDSLAPAASGGGVSVQHFQRGGIWQVTTGEGTATRVVSGATYDAYVANGEADGPLGAPTSASVTTDGTTRTTFVHGSIEVTDGQPPVVVVDGQALPSPEAPAEPAPEPGPTTDGAGTSVAPVWWRLPSSRGTSA